MTHKTGTWFIFSQIFGYKQQGQGAVDAVNVYHHLFYEGNVDIFSITVTKKYYFLRPEKKVAFLFEN